ncbi:MULTISPECIES: hypothetical protein [Rhodococcus]|uniref:hypothetical protein n=1 Tax=Rhodococcus TaxID=1827 RepID=UPI00193C0551|nr:MULTISPECIES: hypothetical protein [Rhodococcus]QRI76261.1 hypothetical protein JQ505_00050 [Rhodococcus aetherivorans]QSE59672.1 hypothetical protein JYA75_01165 [Rhodococcus sp. PSBB066]
MSEATWSIDESDMRRACAAQLHFANTDVHGIAEIIREAVESDRTLALVWALLQLNDTMLAVTYENGGAQKALQQFALSLAAAEGDPK